MVDHDPWIGLGQYTEGLADGNSTLAARRRTKCLTGPTSEWSFGLIRPLRAHNDGRPGDGSGGGLEMSVIMARRARRATAAVLYIMMSVGMAACGSDSGTDVDPAVAPFVGTWDAVVLTLSNGTVTADILDSGGSFFIAVEPSGLYTATLEAFGSPAVQVGQLSVSGSTLTLTPTLPPGEPAATSDYEFQSDQYLVLDGTAEFDINLDGTSETVDAHFELQRR